MGETEKIKVIAISFVSLFVIAILGLVIIENFGIALRTTTTVNLTTSNVITLPLAVNTTGRIGSASQYPYIQSLTGCFNDTAGTPLLPAACYTVFEGDEDGGSLELIDITECGNWTGETINCSELVYKEDSDESNTALLFFAGMLLIGTFAGVLALAWIGRFIVQLFKKEE